MLKRKRSDGSLNPQKKRKTNNESTCSNSLPLISSTVQSPKKKKLEEESSKKEAAPVFFSPTLQYNQSPEPFNNIQKKSIFYSNETLEDKDENEIPDVPMTEEALDESNMVVENSLDEFDPYKFIAMLPVKPEVERNNVLPPTEYPSRKTLVLDLDESLVHSSLVEVENPDIVFKINNENVEYKVFVKIRPGLDNFLKSVKDIFEVVVFTASQKIYAETLLNIIDPNHYIHQRLFREDCIVVNENHIKDLSLLGRDLKNVIIIDNSPHVFGYHIDNGIPIESWFDDPNDKELDLLIPILNELSKTDNVQTLLRNKYKLHELVEKYRSCK